MTTLVTLFACMVLVGQAPDSTKPLARIHVRGVELHYIEQGQGQPLILLHGGQGDYRSWEPQVTAFSRHFRVISYSRRYHYPNDNPLKGRNHSALTEADDLAALMRKLKVEPAHLVGTSYGAFTALALALKHPHMVRSLVLAEPPVHQWVKDEVEGRRAYSEFMSAVWSPAAKMFRAENDEGAMRILVDSFAGTGRFDRLPAEARADIMRNSRFFKAVTLSSNPFPNLPKNRVKRLQFPTLIVTGENTTTIHKLVNEELGRLLPHAERATIPNAGHGSPRENPAAFTEVTLAFLTKRR